MAMKKKVILAVAAVLAIAAAIPAVFWLKQYYEDRYVEDDAYYTVVPLDYDYTPEKLYSAGDEHMGYYKEYRLVCYNAEGSARELAFIARTTLQELYPPGTYVRVSASKKAAIRQNALAEANVPVAALEKIRENFMPSSAATAEEYAEERTRQLSARSTPSLAIVCAVNENALVYTYTYSAGAKKLAQDMAELLDHVYRAQFRTDKETFPVLDAIFLEVKLDDGTVVFSQKYNEIVRFGYEKQPKPKNA